MSVFRLGPVVGLLAVVLAGTGCARQSVETVSSAAATSSAGGEATAGAAATARAGTQAEGPRRPRRLALPDPLPATTVRVPILMYHRVDRLTPGLPSLTRALTVTPDDFAAQVRWLRRSGYRAITTEQLFAAMYEGGDLPDKPILLTFDDGYVDVLRYAAPVLRKARMPAVAYVITNRIEGSDTSFMRWRHLKRLQKAGFEIGSHTVSHRDLTALPGAELARELRASKRTLERGLGRPVNTIAYPAGRFDARVEEAARAAGYVLALTTEPGVTHDARHPFELPRIRVSDTTGGGGLAALLAR